MSRRQAQERSYDQVDPGPLLDVVVELRGHAGLVVEGREVLEKGGAADRAAQQRDARMPGQDVIRAQHRALRPLLTAERAARPDILLKPLETTHRRAVLYTRGAASDGVLA